MYSQSLKDTSPNYTGL